MEEEYSEMQQAMNTGLAGTTTNSRQMAIKNHIEYIVEKIIECNTELHDNRKNLQILRTDLTQIEHINKEDCNDITAKILDELERLSRDFKKITNEEKQENAFLKQQIGQLNQDKVRLQQNVLVLKSRISEAEGNIGSEHFEK